MWKTIVILLFHVAVVSASARLACAADESGYAHQTVTVHDVDLQKLLAELKRWKINIPVQGQGKVTASITVGIPWRHPMTWNAYRFHGSLQSADLVLEGFEFRDAKAEANYSEGLLQLTDSRFTLWDPQSKSAAGHFMAPRTCRCLRAAT